MGLNEFLNAMNTKSVWFLTAAGLITGEYIQTDDLASRWLRLRNAAIAAHGKNYAFSHEIRVSTRSIIAFGQDYAESFVEDFLDLV